MNLRTCDVIDLFDIRCDVSIVYKNSSQSLIHVSRNLYPLIAGILYDYYTGSVRMIHTSVLRYVISHLGFDYTWV
jgi:hypothetical protein